MIEFKFRKAWTDEALATRVAQVIGYTDACPPYFDDGKWTLNSGNDWWLRIDRENLTASLNYRYGHHQEEFTKALQTVLSWIFNPS